MLNHVLNLPSHGDTEKSQKVNEEDRPVDGYVCRACNGTQESDGSRTGCSEPELEFGESTDERAEFLIVFVVGLTKAFEETVETWSC